ncbi:MAG: ketopantoate reductase family protein [Chloroflexi bacterium]|nr:ketopantoate reductase family protein [Chloroflexota bacterium]
MRFIIYGAGGIGCVIGGHLFRQGFEVALVGNAQNMDAINARGLKLVTGDASYMLKIPAFKTAGELLPFRDDDAVLLCAKSQHTVKCLGQLKNAGAPRSLPIFCVQNSIVNEALATRAFDRVYGVMIMIPAIFMTPGEVINPIVRRNGVIEIGRYPRGADDLCHPIADALRRAGFFVNVNDAVMMSKAAKCLLNLGNAFDAISDDKGDGRAFMQAVREEAMQVWRAAGIEWEEREQFQKRVRSEYGERRVPAGFENLEKRSSSWQSLARGTGNIEAEQLNGDVVMLGKSLGIETPYNQLLWRLADEMAARGEKPGKYSVDELTEMVRR